MAGKLALVQFLHARGADLRASDERGQTPLELARDLLRVTREMMGDDPERTRPYEQIIAYLERAEAGARTADSRPAADAEEVKETRRRRELK